MEIKIHQTKQTIADFDNFYSYMTKAYESFSQSKSKVLHLFPSIFLRNFQGKSLSMNREFTLERQSFLERIKLWSLSQGKNAKALFVFEMLDDKGPGLRPSPEIFTLNLGEKEFIKIKKPEVLLWEGKSIGLFRGEDSLHDLFHQCQEKNQILDLMINFNTNPFFLGNTFSRQKKAEEISQSFQCPFIYMNPLGEDQGTVFDGESFIYAPHEKTFKKAVFLQEEMLEFPFPHSVSGTAKDCLPPIKRHFHPRLEKKGDHEIELKKIDGRELERVVKTLGFSLQSYAEKNGFHKFLVALSGGLDSSLVLTLARLFLKKGQSLEAIYMPSQYSSPTSYDLSLKLCQNLGIKLTSFPIKFLHATMRNHFGQYFKENLEGVADENIQSRLRGSILYTRSNQTGAMVLNTSNKSELSIGYSTLYGDTVGAISLLGDLFKSEVYELAKFINEKYKGIIPNEIISRPPSAELREGQLDSEALPPYSVLDPILEAILSHEFSLEEITNMGFKKEDVEKAFFLYQSSDFKRRQLCPIVKLREF